MDEAVGSESMHAVVGNGCQDTLGLSREDLGKQPGARNGRIHHDVGQHGWLPVSFRTDQFSR